MKFLIGLFLHVPVLLIAQPEVAGHYHNHFFEDI